MIINASTKRRRQRAFAEGKTARAGGFACLPQGFKCFAKADSWRIAVGILLKKGV